MDLLLRQMPGIERTHQRSVGHRWVSHVLRQRGHAKTLARRLYQGQQVIGTQLVTHRHRLSLPDGVTKMPARIILQRAVDQCLMVSQILW